MKICQKYFFYFIHYTILLLAPMACSFLELDRSFLEQMTFDQTPFFEPEKDFQVVSGDNDYQKLSKEDLISSTPLRPKERSERSLQTNLIEELSLLEEGLTEAEYIHYSRHKNKIPHISQKIYFLKLPHIRARDEYLIGRGHKAQYFEIGPREAEAIRHREVVVGMSKRAVQQSWGQPMRVDVAGNPQLENERWSFYDQGRIKYVFFEQGKVRGWLIE